VEGDKLYKHHSEMKSYHEALGVCKIEGATLSIPQNQKELNTMIQTITPDCRSMGMDLWLGFYSSTGPNDFFTLNGIINIFL
jgi:hypothetical protein